MSSVYWCKCRQTAKV